MISFQSVPLLAIVASSLTLTCLSQIKSTLYPNLVIFTSETSVEFVIFFLFLQPQLLQIHSSPANLTTVIHSTLASHNQISTNFNAFKTHWHASLQTLQNINTSHQNSKNYTGFQSNKELAKELSLSLVHDFGIHYLLIPEIRLLYQYSVPGSKHTSSKLHSLPRFFPISLDCPPGFWFLLFSFYALSNDTLC